MGGDPLQCCYREQVAYALYARFKCPKMYKYAQSGDWDLIPARCQSHPKEASFVNKYAPNDTPLHRLLRYDCTRQVITDATTLAQMQAWKLQAVQALLKADRQTAAQPDALGRNPLHLACCDDSAVSVAMEICRVNPRAAGMPDRVDQRTPLHYLVARGEGEIPLSLLRLLVETFPEAVRWPDVTGDTPLAIVENRREEISNAEAVLEILRAAQVDPSQQRDKMRKQSSSSRVVPLVS